jgi:exosortase A
MADGNTSDHATVRQHACAHHDGGDSVSTPAIVPAIQTRILTPFRVVLPAIAVGILLFGLMFRAEIAAAVHTWIVSTAYTHCFVVLPIAAYLAWDRRERLIGVPIAPDLRFVWAALPIAVVWLVSERLGIMEGRQLMALSLLQVLLLSVLGWRMWRHLAGPLLYLYFLVPFGAFLTPALQDFTAQFTISGLNLLGIPNYSDGYTIEIAQGVFYVAEACAGLRFLIASVAFGALYSLLMYRSPTRRLIFMGVSIVVPIIANGLRALGIVVLGRILGSAEAAGADHIIYGWVFFSCVILILIVLGLPFREDLARDRTAESGSEPVPANGRLALVAACVVAALGAFGPVAAAGLDTSAVSGMSGTKLALTAGAGCDIVPTGPTAVADTHQSGTVQHFKCGDQVIRVQTEVFLPRTSAGILIGDYRRLALQDGGGDLVTNWLPIPNGNAHIWRMFQSEEPARTVAVALWIDGHPTSPGLRMRAQQAWRSIMGSAAIPAVVVAVTPDADPSPTGPAGQERAHRTIEAFLRQQPSLTEQITALTTGAPR